MTLGGILLAAQRATDAWDWVIGLGLFVGLPIVGLLWAIYGPEGRREKMRRDNPEEFFRLELRHWAKANPTPSRDDLVPVDRSCGNCGYVPLLGSPSSSPGDWWRVPTRLNEEDKNEIRYRGERVAWTFCPSCRDSRPVLGVTHPWTIDQKERAAAAKEKAEARKRRDFAIKRDHEERRKKKLLTMQGLKSLSPPQFERAVGKILEANGYTEVVICGGPGDLTADVKCRDPEGRSVVVQCKRYIDKSVGSKELQSFIGMMTVEHEADRGLYVTTSGFTAPATALARKHGVELIGSEALVDLAQALHSSWDDEAIQDLLKGPPKKPAPPAPQWVRDWRARERRRGQ